MGLLKHSEQPQEMALFSKTGRLPLLQGSYSDTDNPLSLTLNETQYAIQANFQTVVFTGPVNVTLNMATDAIVVVLGAVGGTVSPTPGTYALASATTLNLVATPASGIDF